MTFARLLIPVMLALVPAVAVAQQPAPIELARSIARSAYVSDAARDEFLTQFTASFLAGLDSNPRVTALFAARPALRSTLSAAARREAAAQYPAFVEPALLESVADAYVANFTAPELAELKAYYATPQAQRLLHAFAAPDAAAEVAAARRDPVVARFVASATGRKEAALSATLAQALVAGARKTSAALAAAIQPSLAAAMRAAAAQPVPAK